MSLITCFQWDATFYRNKREVLADYDSSSIAAKLPECNLVFNL